MKRMCTWYMHAYVYVYMCVCIRAAVNLSKRLNTVSGPVSALTLSKLVSPPLYYEPRRAVNRSRCAGNWTGIRHRSLLLLDGLDYEAEAGYGRRVPSPLGFASCSLWTRSTNQLGTRHFVGELVWEEEMVGGVSGWNELGERRIGM